MIGDTAKIKRNFPEIGENPPYLLQCICYIGTFFHVFFYFLSFSVSPVPSVCFSGMIPTSMIRRYILGKNPPPPPPMLLGGGGVLKMKETRGFIRRRWKVKGIISLIAGKELGK
jgi:hypothetical protein